MLEISPAHTGYLMGMGVSFGRVGGGEIQRLVTLLQLHFRVKVEEVFTA